ELTDRRERVIKLGAADHGGQRRLGINHQAPAVRRVKVIEDERSPPAEHLDEIRIELGAAALAGDCNRRVDTADAPEHLDDISQVDQPRTDRDLVTAKAAGTLAVPALITLPEAGPHLLAQAKACRELVRGPGGGQRP